MVISPEQTFLVNTGLPGWGSAGSPATKIFSTHLLLPWAQSRADAQLSVDLCDSPCSHLVAQMNAEWRGKLLSFRKQADLQKGQATVSPFAWKTKGTGKLEWLGAVVEKVQEKIGSGFTCGLLCFVCPLPARSWDHQPARRRERLPCLQGGASQDRLFHYALHIHLATDKGSNSFNSFRGENYFKLCSTPVCQAHPRYELCSDSNVHTQGHIPPVALRN